MKRVTYLASIVTILAGAFFAYSIILGNPITKFKLDKESNKYIINNYPEISENVFQSSEGAYYLSPLSTKEEGKWLVYYYGKESEILNFALVYNTQGKMIFDGYKEQYLKGATIITHFSDIYKDYFIDIHNEVYNNGMPSVVGSKTNGHAYLEHSVRNSYDEYTGPVLDMSRSYTMEELANEFGVIQFQYERLKDEEVTIEKFICLRNEAKEIVLKYNIPFKTVNILYHDLSGCLLDVERNIFLGDDFSEYAKENFIDLHKNK